MGLSAVGAGGLDEHDHLPRLDLAVHKLLSHADRLQLLQGPTVKTVDSVLGLPLRTQGSAPCVESTLSGCDIFRKFLVGPCLALSDHKVQRIPAQTAGTWDTA